MFADYFFSLFFRRSRMFCLSLACLFLLAQAVSPPSAFAAFGDKPKRESVALLENPLHASARLIPSSVGAGGTSELVIDLDLAKGYHAYLERFKLVIESPDDLKLDQFKIGPIIKFKDVVSKTDKDGVKEHAVMRALVEVPTGFRLGEHTLKVKLSYQACTEEFCLFPKSLSLEAPLQVTAEPTAHPIVGRSALESAEVAPPPLPGPTNEFQEALKKGTLSTLLFLFIVGFLTSLTPCIYPMIPITVAILGAGAKGRSHLRSFALSTVYVLGIALTYSLLGVTAASTGALFGALLSNVWVVTALALLFVAMGLSMYGLFEIQPPAFIRDRFANAKTGSGFGGAFSAGLIAGIVASPCVGPVLVSILAHIAQTQDRVLGFVYLFTFAIGLGIPFVALGTSSFLLNHVPKAGPWMETIKFIFGTTMIAMALYYVRPLYSMGLFHFLQGITAVAISSFYGAFDAAHELKTPLHRLRKGLMLMFFIVGLVFATSGLAKMAGLQLPGVGLLSGTAPSNYLKLPWQPYSATLRDQSLRDGRPILIDFYADWCAACVELEEFTFTDAEVRSLSSRFTLLKVDATQEFDGLNELRKEYGVQGLPTLQFYDVNSRLREDLKLTGFEPAKDFVQRMKKALIETPKLKSEPSSGK